MISFTEEAVEYLKKNEIKEIFIFIEYVKGPCSDNLCKMIPKIRIATSMPEKANAILIFPGSVKVFAAPPIAKTIERHRDSPKISLTRIGKKLRVDGITYSF